MSLGIYSDITVVLNVTHYVEEGFATPLYLLLVTGPSKGQNHYLICQIWPMPVEKLLIYTLSHPENDRDVTEHAQGYTLQDASFMRQSRCSFLIV